MQCRFAELGGGSGHVDSTRTTQRCSAVLLLHFCPLACNYRATCMCGSSDHCMQGVNNRLQCIVRLLASALEVQPALCASHSVDQTHFISVEADEPVEIPLCCHGVHAGTHTCTKHLPNGVQWNWQVISREASQTSATGRHEHASKCLSLRQSLKQEYNIHH